MLSQGKVPFVEDAKKGAFGALDPKALQNSSFGNKWSDLRGSGPTVFSMAGDVGPVAVGQCVGALTRIEPAAKVLPPRAPVDRDAAPPAHTRERTRRPAGDLRPRRVDQGGARRRLPIRQAVIATRCRGLPPGGARKRSTLVVSPLTCAVGGSSWRGVCMYVLLTKKAWTSLA